MKNMSKNEKMVVNMVIDSYVNVMGVEKWDSLTEEQQHDAIMAIVMDFGKTIAFKCEGAKK